MIEYLDEVMKHCAGLIKDHFKDGKMDDDLCRAVQALNYSDPQRNDFHYEDPLHNAVYFIRYGYAYAYEYDVIYEIILNEYKSRDNVFGVTTFGCGSCLDAWALAYAKSRIGTDVSLRYAGNDLKVWGILMKPENGNALAKAYQRDDGTVGMNYPGMEGMQRDILVFLRTEEYPYKYNTIMFSKILNELPWKLCDDLIGVIRENADKFISDRTHYICISHSKSQYQKSVRMKTIAREIVDAINYDGRFNVDDSLPQKNPKLHDISCPEDLACYEFKKNKNGYFDKIRYLNEDFEPVDEVNEAKEIIENNKYKIEMKNIFNKPLGRLSDEEGQSRKCVVNTNTSLFQVIKLEPKAN